MRTATTNGEADDPTTPKLQYGTVVLTSIMLPLTLVVGGFAGTGNVFDPLRGVLVATVAWVTGALITVVKPVPLGSAGGQSLTPTLGLVAGGVGIAAVAVFDDALVPWSLASAIGVLGGWITTTGLIELWRRNRRRPVA